MFSITVKIPECTGNVKRQSMKVYCKCRCSDRLYVGKKLRDEEKMIQCGTKLCKEWYHKECLPEREHTAFEKGYKSPC